jgi:predicted amidophosphoribosyltransferase
VSSPKLTIEETSNAYANAMRNPPLPRAGVCPVCKMLYDPGYPTCISCHRQPDNLDAFLPITYSVHAGQMHEALRDYKDNPYEDVRRYHGMRLIAILWRFIEQHEPCVARATGVDAFDLVATVPSKTHENDRNRRGLRSIVGIGCLPTADRRKQVLSPADPPELERIYSEDRYIAGPEAEGQRVLLIDDTWTTGASMQSAAFALRRAGALNVAGVAIGRHLHLDFSWDGGSCEQEYKAASDLRLGYVRASYA